MTVRISMGQTAVILHFPPSQLWAAAAAAPFKQTEFLVALAAAAVVGTLALARAEQAAPAVTTAVMVTMRRSLQLAAAAVADLLVLTEFPPMAVLEGQGQRAVSLALWHITQAAVAVAAVVGSLGAQPVRAAAAQAARRMSTAQLAPRIRAEEAEEAEVQQMAAQAALASSSSAIRLRRLRYRSSTPRPTPNSNSSAGISPSSAGGLSGGDCIAYGDFVSPHMQSLKSQFLRQREFGIAKITLQLVHIIP